MIEVTVSFFYLGERQWESEKLPVQFHTVEEANAAGLEHAERHRDKGAVIARYETKEVVPA